MSTNTDLSEADYRPHTLAATAAMITGISMEKYDELPDEERAKYEQRIPEQKLREWEAAEREMEQYRPSPLSQVKDVNWRLPGVLVDKGVTCLVGESEAGKTTLSLQLSKALLDGEPFFGLPVQQIKTVLWVELDESASMLKDQAAKIDPLLPDKLVVWDDVSWNADKGILKPLGLVVLKCEPQLIILDALNSVGLESENSNSEIAKLYRCLRVIAQHCDLSVLLLHHLAKPQEGYAPKMKHRVRGAGDIVGKADCVLALERSGYAAKLSTVKVRSKIRLDIDLQQDPETLLYRIEQSRAEFITELLLRGKSRAEVVKAVCAVHNIKKDTAEKAVDRARRELQDKQQSYLGKATGGQN